MRFASFAELRSACLDLPAADEDAAAAAAARDAVLTKPPKSLGRLEELAFWLAAWQAKNPPRLDRIDVLVFAGNHGVTAQGVSAFPAEVTVQRVEFHRRRRRHQSAEPRRGRQSPRHPARSRPADRGLHGGARHG